MTSTIKFGESFTVNQILNSNGFTLDTTDFPDLLDDEEDELDYAKSIQLNNQEMLRLLNLEDDNDDTVTNEMENVAFVGIAFDTLRQKMQSIYEDGKILKLIKKEGIGEIVPKDAQVTVEYVGYFEFHDEPFDSTLFHRDKRAVLNLGRGEIIAGLEIAISTMRKHEKALFLIQPELAYGKLGCLPRVPPDSEVLFKVELVNILDIGSAYTYDDLSSEDKKKFSIIEKIIRDLMTKGMDSFKRQKIKQAIREYNRATSYLEKAQLENDEEESKMNTLLSRALTNLTVCYNKVNKPKLACSAFQRLPNEPNSKAYFQYGKALANLGDYDKAMEILQKARKLSPHTEEIISEIKNVEGYRQKYLDFSKRFAQNSLKLNPTKDKKSEEFEKVAIDMCDFFIEKSNALKQQIPHGLLEQEIDCIKRVAASRGLSIIKQSRYDTESLYLVKNSYYMKDSL